MIMKGRSYADGKTLAEYLEQLRAAKGGDLRIMEVSGESEVRIAEGAVSLQNTFARWEIEVRGTRCRKPFWHAVIAPMKGETYTPDWRREVVRTAAWQLGLEDQPHAVIFHRSSDEREVLHVVWLRLDLVTGKVRKPRSRKDNWGYGA